jgi:hypothetical protein
MVTLLDTGKPGTRTREECYKLDSSPLQWRIILYMYKSSSTRDLDWKLLMKSDEFNLEHSSETMWGVRVQRRVSTLICRNLVCTADG